jgi:hypothetical protein
MKSSQVSFCRWNLAKWSERLAVDAKVATVLGSFPASSDTVESEGRQMKQCWIMYIKIKKIKKIPPLLSFCLKKYAKEGLKKLNKLAYCTYKEASGKQ